MTTQKPPGPQLPHHTLFAYQLCLELVRLVARIRIGDPQLRQQARKSAGSAALNAAEGAARESAGDKRRSYGIASGAPREACQLRWHARGTEDRSGARTARTACECAAALEIAGALGTCSPADVAEVVALVLRIRRVFSPLVR